jgi:ABC-type multidrug transport system fused ATPase/permease subunit
MEKQMDKRDKVLGRFLKYVKPYTVLIVLAVIGGIIKFSVPLIFPRIMQYFIDDLFSPGSIMSTNEKMHELNKWTLIILGIYTFIWIPGTYIRHYFVVKAGHKVIYKLRYDLYKHIQHMSASFYNQNQSGGIVSIIMNDIALAQNLIGNALTNIWMDGFLVIILLIIMIKMDPILTLASLTIFPVYILVGKKLGRKVKENSHLLQEETQEMSAHIQEKISAYSVVQAFAQEKHEKKAFKNESKNLLEYQLNSGKLSSINTVIAGFLTAIAPIIVVWVGCIRVNEGILTIGQLITFYAYLGNFYTPINRFAELNVVFGTSMASLERVFRTMDLPADINDKPDAIPCKNIKGDIEFSNLYFKYDEEHITLHDVNLKIDAGKRVAIVGASGSGKTTLVSLLPRFYDASSGQITIDGIDLRDYQLHSLRENIGIVLQETVLFSGTIRDNILYGRLDATEQEIMDAAKAANAYDFIMDLPDKFDTMLGERGTRLSGGQKQRIAISRVFIKNPRILILDEATSALDSESENLIQDALERLMEGRTTIIIAHRLSTVIDANEIVVMNKGVLIERGPHEELLKKGGYYKHLYDAQFASHEVRMFENI